MYNAKLFLNSIMWVSIFFSLCIGCAVEEKEKKIEELKNEIIKAERDFAELLEKEGIAKAFLNYAAENAVLNRSNKLIKGKEEIHKYFDSQTLTEIKLSWTPDFVDVARSGDMAYTYGQYTFSAIDTNGDSINSEGVFHTVWKRQTDGTWKFVWD